MRSTLLPAVTALSCFVAGFFAVREMERTSSANPVAPAGALSSASAHSVETGDAASAAAMTYAQRTHAWFGFLAERRGWSASSAEDHALVAALLHMTPEDFHASAAEMLDYLNRNDSIMNVRACQVCDAWLGRWLEIDAPGALEYLESSSFLTNMKVLEMDGSPLGSWSQASAGGVYAALAAQAPEWLRTQLAAMKDGESVQLGLFALLRESARRDPAQAAQMLAAMPAGTRRTAALTGYVTGLAQVDARQALEITLKETEDFTRQELLRAIFRRAGTYGLARTRELLACLDNPEQRLEQTISALGMLGQEGREDLFPFVQEETARLVAAGGWKSDFDGWANTLWWAARPGQERAFAEWALHFPEGEDRPMLGTVLNRWGRYDAAGCLAWLGANANALDGAAMKRTLNSLRMIGATDPNALRAWAETLPPGTLRDYARFQVAVGTRGEEDVAPALAAYPSVASVDTTGTLATQLARVLVAQDGETSARWAQSLPAGKARTEALSTVASYWSQQDPHGMARWLDQQPPGPERDLLLKGFAAASSVLDTRGAAEWVEQIDDVAQRTEAAQRVYHRWKIENPIAARQWLRQLGGVDATEIRQTLRHGR